MSAMYSVYSPERVAGRRAAHLRGRIDHHGALPERGRVASLQGLDVTGDWDVTGASGEGQEEAAEELPGGVRAEHETTWAVGQQGCARVPAFGVHVHKAPGECAKHPLSVQGHGARCAHVRCPWRYKLNTS